jgi:hypothetical protein
MLHKLGMHVRPGGWQHGLPNELENLLPRQPPQEQRRLRVVSGLPCLADVVQHLGSIHMAIFHTRLPAVVELRSPQFLDAFVRITLAEDLRRFLAVVSCWAVSVNGTPGLGRKKSAHFLAGHSGD